MEPGGPQAALQEERAGPSRWEEEQVGADEPDEELCALWSIRHLASTKELLPAIARAGIRPIAAYMDPAVGGGVPEKRQAFINFIEGQAAYQLMSQLGGELTSSVCRHAVSRRHEHGLVLVRVNEHPDNLEVGADDSRSWCG